MNINIQNIYPVLREHAFTLKPEEIDIDTSNLNGSAYGLIMEFVLLKNSVTLVTYITGDASLYLSTGGGVIGGIDHNNVKNAVFQFINEGNKYLSKTNKVSDFPLAISGKVIFYLLTEDGILKMEDTESKLKSKKSEFWSLYYSGQDVITELRKAEQN
ncbi:hypothetical protein FACS1894130_08220 [Spirochaetia bacterium]|nr:hypothetical protein FACS1894130_08220 [Spirochaetia bacterium]